MRDWWSNIFHATIPVTGEQTLQEVRVEFTYANATITKASVHQGSTLVTETANLAIGGDPSTLATLSNSAVLEQCLHRVTKPQQRF
jgi:hypothetical protein